MAKNKSQALSALALYNKVTALMRDGKVLAAYTPTIGGVAEAVFKMAVGNKLGFDYAADVDMFRPVTGFIFEGNACECEKLIGKTKTERNITFGSEKADLEALITEWEKPLEGIFPTKAAPYGKEEKPLAYTEKHTCAPAIKVAKPKVLIPVFMGTNCEYDSAKAFEKAGAESEIIVVRDLTPAAVTESVTAVGIKCLRGTVATGDQFVATEEKRQFIKNTFNASACEMEGAAVGHADANFTSALFGAVGFDGEGRAADLLQRACKVCGYGFYSLARIFGDDDLISCLLLCGKGQTGHGVLLRFS